MDRHHQGLRTRAYNRNTHLGFENSFKSTKKTCKHIYKHVCTCKLLHLLSIYLHTQIYICSIYIYIYIYIYMSGHVYMCIFNYIFTRTWCSHVCIRVSITYICFSAYEYPITASSLVHKAVTCI